jgi:hypothetical protein
MFSELCRETLRRAVANGYLGYIVSLRDDLDDEDELQEDPTDQEGVLSSLSLLLLLPSTSIVFFSSRTSSRLIYLPIDQV